MSQASGHDYGDLRVTGPAHLDADVVVVGSGAGGSTVALTAIEQGLSVLVLEEGPYVPAAKAPARMADSFKKLWRNGGLTAAYGAPPVTYAEGRCVGGSTEINSAIFQRAPEDLLHTWASNYKILDFSMKTLAPHYDWAASLVNASVTPEPLGPPTDILARAGAAMGWETKTLERGQRDCVGTNMCASACPTAGKQSMSTVAVPQILKSGARILAEAKVKRIKLKNRRVSELHVTATDTEGQRHQLRVTARKFFLCAGAIQTPALLQSAGISRIAGQRLRLHPTIKLLAFFDEAINAHNHRLPLVAVTQFMPDLRLGGSVFTPATFGLSLAEDWAQRASYIRKMNNAVIYYAMVRGQGHGRVRAMPNGAAPVVTYKLDQKDWYGLGTGVARLGQALLRTGAKQVLPSITGHAGWTEEKQAGAGLDQSLSRKKSQIMSIHLFGSCPLGENQDFCVADSFGRVHGIDNLYLADAGVIPEAPGVNPQATVMAIARRNALYILGGSA